MDKEIKTTSWTDFMAESERRAADMSLRARLDRLYWSIHRFIKNIPYYFRARWWHRYHIVDCRNDYYAEYPYRWGWIDRDHLMLLACFNILVDFIENEHPFEVTKWERDGSEGEDGVPDSYWEECGAAKKELNELYVWWCYGRRFEHEKATRMFKDNDPDWMKFHDEVEDRDNVQLMRLMKVRRYMWT